jgi:hypothetical protein
MYLIKETDNYMPYVRGVKKLFQHTRGKAVKKS